MQKKKKSKLVLGNKMLEITICPKCGNAYEEHPAISRINGAEICPECGIKEALDAFFKAKDIA